MNLSNFQGKKSKKNKYQKAIIFSQKARRILYSDLDDFLKNIPIATMNGYGEPVISGRRIC